MVNKELGNTATCIKQYAGIDLDTSDKKRGVRTWERLTFSTQQYSKSSLMILSSVGYPEQLEERKA